MALKSKEMSRQDFAYNSGSSTIRTVSCRDEHLKLRNFKPVEIGELLAEPGVGDIVETKRIRAVVTKIWPDCLSCERRRRSFRRYRLRGSVV